MWLAGLASNLAGAACEPVPASEVETAVQQAVALYSVAADQFAPAAERALGMVECLSEPASTSLAAAIHGVYGRQLATTGDDLGAQRALSAAYRIDPRFDASDVGAVASRARSDVTPGPSRPFRLAGYIVQIDGRVSGERPVDGPYLMQVFDPKGAVATTQYVSPGEDPAVPRDVRALAATNASLGSYMPDLTISSAPLAYTAVHPITSFAPVPHAPRGGGGGGSSKALLWAGVASGGLAAGMYGTAVYGRVSYDRVPSPNSYMLTNTAYLSSIGTASLSGLLLTTYLIVR
ncbi:MAG: hypothetical protein ABMA64_29440 [Myxococcota bacterium]